MTAFKGRPVWAASGAIASSVTGDRANWIDVADLNRDQRQQLEAEIHTLLSGVGTGEPAWLTDAPNAHAVIARRQVSDREWDQIGDAPSSCSAAPGQTYVPVTPPTTPYIR